MSDDRTINKHTTDASNNNGRVRGHVNNNNNAQIFAKNAKNPLFSETTEFKITKITQKEENRTEEKED